MRFLHDRTNDKGGFPGRIAALFRYFAVATNSCTPELPLSTNSLKGSRGLRVLLEWIRTLPLNRTEREAMCVYAEHANYWDGSGSRPSPQTVAKLVRVTSRHAQRMLRKFLADPECDTCEGTGSLKEQAGGIVRCECHKKELGYLVVEQPVPPISWRLNVKLPITAALAKKEKSAVSTASTDSRHQEARPDATFSQGDSDNPEGQSRHSEDSSRHLDARNKDDRRDRRSDRSLPSSTPPPVDCPLKIKTGLREIVSNLDDKAITQIWEGCREYAPDCTVDEILHFAWTKAHAAWKARNPTGFLIATLPICFYGDSFQDWRADQRIEAARNAAAELARGQEEADSRRRVQEQEREEEALKLAIAALNTLPADEFKALHFEVEKSCAWIPECRRKMPSAALESMIRREMAKAIMRRPQSNAVPQKARTEVA
jgi:hypothetical protein